MAFTDLSLEAQNFLLVNHDYVAKWLLFIILIFFSSYYLFVVWKEQKETIYFTVVITRLVFAGLSIGYLVASPITLLLMSPELSFQEFFHPYLVVYLVMIAIAGVVAGIDFIRYGIVGLFQLAGLNLNDSNAKEFANTFYNNKHFLKRINK